MQPPARNRQHATASTQQPARNRQQATVASALAWHLQLARGQHAREVAGAVHERLDRRIVERTGLERQPPRALRVEQGAVEGGRGVVEEELRPDGVGHGAQLHRGEVGRADVGGEHHGRMHVELARDADRHRL